jgi:PilZ domain
VTPELPHLGEPVSLVVDDARIRARVTVSTQDHVDLGVDGVPSQLRGAPDAVAMLEYVDDRGPCRLLGTATLVAGEDGEPLVRFTHEGMAQLLLRRDRVRAPVEVEIEVEVGGETRATRTRDLRGNGALVHGPFEAEPGDLVRYRFRLPGRSTALEGTADVARVNDDGDLAIHFLELDAADAADITLAVFEAQRRRD